MAKQLGQKEIANISGELMKFEIDGTLIELKPGERTKINEAYATPRVMQEGKDPVPATVAMITNNKVLPIDDPRAMRALGIKANQPAPATHHPGEG